MRDQEKTKEQLLDELALARQRLARLEARKGQPSRVDRDSWFRRAVVASRDGILITDPNLPDDPIVYANPAFEQMTGYRAEEVMGRNCRFLQGSDRDQAALDTLRTALAEGRGCSVILRNYRKDGTPFWNELHVSPVHDEEGRLVNYIGIQDDVTDREWAEEKIQFQAHLLEQVQTAVIATDMRGSVTHWNRYAEELYGWSREEALGRNIRGLTVGPTEAEVAEEIMERLVAGKSWEGELVTRRKDGSTFPAYVTDSLIRDAQGEAIGIVGISTDITGQKQAEETLRRDAGRLSSVIAIQQEIATAKLESAAVMNLVVERVRALIGADGAAIELVEGDELVYRAASGTAARHVGLRLKVAASISGRCIRSGELLISDDTEEDERVDREACRRIGARSMIVVPLHNYRRTVGVLKVISGRPHAFEERDVDTVRLMTGLIAAGMSHTAEFEVERALVAERTAALAKIQESEAHFRTIFEGAAIGIALVNSEGRILETNPALQKMLGYGPEELRDMSFADVTHPEDVATNREMFRELNAGERDRYELEKRYLRKDGQTLWGRLRGSLVPSSGDDGPLIIGMVENITEHKRAEEALYEIREAERRRIARDLHDAVLQDISGALQTMQAHRLETRDPDDGGVSRALDALRLAVRGLRGAIYDLHRDGEQLVAREVGALVELNRQMAPAREITLVVDDGFPEELAGAVGHEVLRIVHEALVNIRRHSFARRASVTLGVSGDEIRTEVSDNGRGFDPATTPEGVGIAGMRERALAIGGRLDLRSETGKGTSVTVSVPLK